MSALMTSAQPSDSDLFGGYASLSNKTSIWALSKIVLPDGHAYQFRYNQYAEVASLDLPTGGRYEIDWTNGPGTDPYDCLANLETGKCPVIRAPFFMQPPGGDQLIAVYRRVKERREYANGGSSWSRRTTYDVTEIGSGVPISGDPLGQCGSTTNATFISGSCTKATLKEFDPQGPLSTEDHYFYGAVSKYQSLFPQSGWYPWWLEGKEFRTDILQPAGTTLRQHVQTWNVRAIPSWWFSGIGPQPPVDPRIGGKDVIIDGGKMARKLFAYSSTENTNNVSDLWEYDYGNTAGSQGALLRHAHTDFLTNYNNPVAPAPVYLRDLIATEKIYNGAGVLAAQTDFSYDETALSGAPVVQHVTVGSLRGNRTKTKRWRNTDGAILTTTFTYDVAGNVMSRKNPRGNTKYFSYEDCGGAYAFLTSVINELYQTTTWEHDCSLGVVTSITDANQYQTRAFYGGVQDGGPPEPLDRPSKLIAANGQQTTYRYSSDLTMVTRAADQDILGPDQYTVGDQMLRTVTISDRLGRVTETRTYTSATNYISTKQDLDALGRARKSYNPVEMAEGQNYWNTNATSFTYDSLGRIVATTYADGAQDTFTWTGDTVVITDSAGKQRKLQMDGLDRIIAVTEDPFGQSFVTGYSYDALDNLVQVTQGAQTRSYTYNSLKQLRSITNPEVGSVVVCDNQLVSECYSYDTQPPNDTLKTKSVGGATTTFTYDLLDRLSRKSYSDSTPQVDYAYDWSQIGCLYSTTNSVARTTFSVYGPECLVLGSVQTVGSQSFTFSYSYNLASALTHEWYPSGRLVTYHYDRAGRTDRVGNGNLNGSSSFANNITYAPHGALASMRLGVTTTNSGWTESWQYNNRLQPTAVNVGSGLLALAFSYCSSGASSCTTNNGNLMGQAITRSGTTWIQRYVDAQNNPAYDAINRLTSAQEVAVSGGAAWSETFGYDRYGNRWLSSYPGLPAPNAETPTASATYLANNRVAAWEYNDGRGNITAMPYMQRSYSYDAENRQTSASVNGVNATYAYDGAGRRIKKTVNGVTTTYVYDALERLAAEYSSQVVSGIGTQYRHVDHLGSTRLVVNATGTPIPSGCHDFRPFGQELLAGTNGRNATCFPSVPAAGLEFTGKERDAESGLDYFGARYFSAAQGRFTSADSSFADQDTKNPQSWNLYSYTRNNPLKYVDRRGEAIETAWDVFNVGLGIGSFVSNVKQGNYLSASVDAVGVVLDTAAAAVPFVPGGLGTLIKAAQIADKAVDKTELVTNVNRFDNVMDTGKSVAKSADAPYKRPSGATTAEQRAAVQGKPCVDCGQAAPRMNADHKKPLVKEHYETGTIDKNRMRQKDAVQPHCPTCSNRQGANLSRYSREQRRRLEEQRLREQQ